MSVASDQPAVPGEPERKAPSDAAKRRSAPPVICYPPTPAVRADLGAMQTRRAAMRLTDIVTVPPREALCVTVPRGAVLRIVSVNGPQVGDLNIWNAADLSERFYSGKTRALHGTHVTTGDRLWSNFPTLRPLATIIDDTLNWYGRDGDGAGVHDVIGTRCDPYTNRLLTGTDYHHCCHSNLTRALAAERGLSIEQAEENVHDVLNVFMCTGFTHATGQYFMKASPARPGDFIEFFAEVDCLAALSACPGGDCGSEHSSDAAPCFPLRMEVYVGNDPAWPEPERSGYPRTHRRHGA